MPFDSRKQQQWYHATDQDFYDDEPSSARKVKGEGFLDSISDYASRWGIELDSYAERQSKNRGKTLEDNMDLSLWGIEDEVDAYVDEAWGSWADEPEPMTAEEEIEYLKSFGIFDSTLKDMGLGHLLKKGEDF